MRHGHLCLCPGAEAGLDHAVEHSGRELWHGHHRAVRLQKLQRRPWRRPASSTSATSMSCPLVLSWHFKQFDFCRRLRHLGALGRISTPVRRCDRADSPGNGYWSHMFTLGGVWYPDEKKTWAVSLLNRYEINTEQDQTRHHARQHALDGMGLEQNRRARAWTWVWSAIISSKSPRTAARTRPRRYSDVVGIGPEVSVFWAKIGTSPRCAMNMR